MLVSNLTTGVDCMERQDVSSQSEARRVAQPYVAPRLTLYGAMSALTATGSSGPNESNSGSSSGMNCTPNFKQSNSC